jgi:hypothetical protein
MSALKPDNRLLFGPSAAAVLLAGIAVLPLWVPGFSQVRQTVSEIGEMDSPARIPFAIMLCAVALCLLIFALGVGAESKRAGRGCRRLSDRSKIAAGRTYSEM